MPLGILSAGGNNLLTQIYQIMMILSFLIFPALIIFGPKLMVWQVDRKMKDALLDLESYKDATEAMFLEKLTSEPKPGLKDKMHSLKNFQMSAPTQLDPAGMVQKLEHVLDTSEAKFDRFVRNHADTEDEEELADLTMAFKGVMGTNQIYKVMNHFRQLIKKTQNFQMVGLVNMMMPIYKEIAEAQKDATRAFINQAPTGDGIGPLVAAKLIESEEEPEEIAEDVISSEETIDGNTVHVVKSRGPGARLGKYGDAVETLAEENDLEAVITVDAAGKFEGEETGSVYEGVGVMMGGSGVEKTKIEEAATDHNVPLEGVVIKQAPPEASKPMKKEIYEAYHEAVDKVNEIVGEYDGEVAVVGVGNTCGVGNTRSDVAGVHNRLRKFWKEYEEQEEEDVSYQGMMGVMPGGDSAQMEELKKNILWNMPR
ncbi:DUF1512 family protein [Candidatus Nanohalovita haloferacivicina]|uniref:DUF1512 family protein n=1 Tax=Candidatus Nanohalovita haloferacivicina TaxID=2978046 RepID=UPI00325F979E|nr:DUF1512 family protein [Candidatus Nanohalobia archaeon BNXNv]